MPGIKSIFHISEMHHAVHLINLWLHHQAVQWGDQGWGTGQCGKTEKQKPHGYPPAVQASQEGGGLESETFTYKYLYMYIEE